MRAAKVGDWWRRVYEKKYPLRLSHLRYQNVIGLGTGDVAFRGGVTAICGENGAGKSTLLNALLHGVSDGDPTLSGSRFAGAELRASVHLAGGDGVVETTFSPYTRSTQLGAIPIQHLAPAAASQDLITFLNNVTNFGELLEAYSPKVLNEADLATRAYVVGRDYESCEVFEIEDYEDRPVFPYFRVRIAGLIYGSEMMGLGELAIHLTLWQLERMADPSILLLEEPETHIAPRSQAALLDVIARTSVRRNLWVVLSTHSAPMLAHVPREHVRLLYRTGVAANVKDTPTHVELNQILGVPAKPLGVLLAEDLVAQLFARAWLNISAPEILHQVLVHVGGSAGEIDASIKNFPRIDAGFRLIGLYDGDQRATVADRPRPCAFLPGDQSPERLLKAAAVDVELVAVRFARTPDEIRLTLSQIEGMDPHDWLHQLGQRLALRLPEVVAALVAIWLATTSGAEASVSALTSLREALVVDLTTLDD